MANIKISELPLYTGNTYNGYIIWNDSGETTTYKTKYLPGLVAGTGTDSIKSNLTSTPATASGTNSIAIGKGAQGTNTNSISIGTSQVAGAFSVGIGNNLNGVGTGSIVLGNAIYNNSGSDAITIGNDLACYGNSIVIGSGGHRSIGTNNVVIGINNTPNIANYSVVLGTISNANSGQRQVIIGRNNNITSTNNDNSIIGGNGNIISGTTSGTTLIGLINFTKPLLNDLTYTNNYHALRTYSTEVQSVSSGTTFTCNLNNGGKAQFYLTGSSTIDITNVRDGQSFLIKTQTDGGHTITWSSTGYTFKWKGASSNPGNNKIDLFRFEVFGTVIYGELISDFS